MALQFGVGRLTCSGVAIARLHNITVNVTYDNAVMRGDTRIFPDHCALYNGAIEGSFEWGELVGSGLSDLIGGTGTFAGGSGTVVLTATQTPSAIALVMSGITDGVTCTVTLNRVRINNLSLKFDRENYLMPSANFICIADASTGAIMTIQQ